VKRPLAFELLSPVRQEIVLLLKKRGPRDMETLAEELFLSVGAVRQNLAALAAQGVVRYKVERAGPGRPRHIFELSRNGQHMFPDFYEDLVNVVLDAVDDAAPEAAGRIYSRATENLAQNLAARLQDKAGQERIDEMVTALQEYGYLPEVTHPDDSTTEVTIFHCPLYEVAQRHPEACTAELRCLQLAAEPVDVSRSSHRVSGDAICAFVFREN
jgi:predicted ArsR family transcriptional regulator